MKLIDIHQYYLHVENDIGLELDINQQPSQYDRKFWPEMKQKFTQIFASRTRDEWCTVFQNLDACVTPVLDVEEAGNHNINSERNVFFTDADGVQLPSPAPRLHGKVNKLQQTKQDLVYGKHSEEILLENDFNSKEIKELIQNDIIKQAHFKSSL